MITLPEPRLLTAGQMARQLGVPVRWLKAEAEAERVPHLKADTVLLFEPETVEQVLVERARQGLAATAAVVEGGGDGAM